MAMTFDRVEDLVSLERGEVNRKIFSDPEIFEQEMQNIFGRAWQFIGHETQIPKAGDYFEAPLGRDNVLVVRQKDGSIKGLLNTCTHRGNAVCRAEEGNTKAFMCTYHGWTFGLDGKLIGVPGMAEFYNNELDKDALGLAEVAQLDSYHGFMFATMDHSAPPLTEYLGAAGRLSFDLLWLRGDLEIVPGIQKFVIPCNWKFAVDNLFDWYHPQITHMSAVGMFRDPNQELSQVVDHGGAMTPDGVNVDEMAGGLTQSQDSIVVLGEYGHAIAGPNRAAQEQSILANPAFAAFSLAYRDTPEASAILGEIGKEVAGHPNIFPNTWITNMQISLRVPRTPNSTEIWWFTFVPKEMAPEHRTMVVGMANHIFGPAGMLEQEDGENWAQSTMGTTGYRSQQLPQMLKMGLGRGKVLKQDGLASISSRTTEHAQLWTYAAWAKWMTGCDWDELRAGTEPPDVI